MPTDLQLLLLAAITISFLHTVTGPDHYLPLIALSKSRGWSLPKTIWWTLVCGSAHVFSSVLLGMGGVALGWSFSKITGIETIRGDWAGWLLLTFGTGYAIWGLIRARQNRTHRHFDVYADGSVYVYEHQHGSAVAPNRRHAVTPWVLFLVFILGPCEPMLPLLYLPAAKHSVINMGLLVGVYTLFTLASMVALVALCYLGIPTLKTEKLEPYMHALAGTTIFTCGLGVLFLNW